MRVAATVALRRGLSSKRGTGLEASARALSSAKLCPLPLKNSFGLVRVDAGGEEAVRPVWNFGVGQIHAGLVGDQALPRPENLNLVRRGQADDAQRAQLAPIRSSRLERASDLIGAEILAGPPLITTAILPFRSRPAKSS